MKKIATLLLLTSTIFACSDESNITEEQQPKETSKLTESLKVKNTLRPDDVPKFISYPAESIYQGENHPLVMDRFGKKFKTRLRKAIKNGKPTFAGRYIVTSWGNSGAIIDAKTGKAYPFPVAITSVYPLKKEFAHTEGKEKIYQQDSRLMIFAGDLITEHSEGHDVVEFYEFDGEQFNYLTTEPYGKGEKKIPKLTAERLKLKEERLKLEEERLKLKADKLKAEKLKADKLKADKLKADKLKADKLKADKLKADKLKEEAKCKNTVFSCTTKHDKLINVCKTSTDYIYQYGKMGKKAEIMLKRLHSDVIKTPMLTEDNEIPGSIGFVNKGTTYSVFTFMGRPNSKGLSAGVSIEQGGKQIANVKCHTDNIQKDTVSVELEGERLTAEKLEAEKLETDKLKADKLEADKLEADKLKAEKIEAEKIEAEKLETDKLETDKLKADKLEAEKLEAEKLEAEKLKADKLEAEKIEADKLAADKLAAEKLEADKLEADKLEADKIKAEKLEAEKLAAEELKADKLKKEKLKEKSVVNTIPPQYHGVWNASAENCHKPSDGYLEIKAQEILHHETGITVQSITTEGSNLVIQGSWASEGETGFTENTLSLQENKLIYNDRPMVKCNKEEKLKEEKPKEVPKPKEASKAAPKFKDYPAKTTYSGKNHPLVMDEFSKQFKTRLNAAIKEGKPTFAGHYIVTGWGCGSGGCNTGAIIDAKTGKAYPFPVAMASVYPLKKEFADEDGQEHIYNQESRMMIFAGALETEHGDGNDVVQFYEFDGTQFKHIMTKPYGKGE